MKYRRKPALGKVLSICLLAILLCYLLFYFLLPIRKIECLTQFENCQDKYITPFSFMLGKSMLSGVPSANLKNLIKKYPEIKSIKVNKKLPNTLSLHFELRIPIGAIGENVSSPYSIVDENGTIIANNQLSDLPILIVANRRNLTQLSRSQILSLKILGLISSLSRSKIVGSLENNTLAATLNDSTLVVIDIERSSTEWYAPLQLILDRSKISSKLPKKIDLRYSDPVITY